MSSGPPPEPPQISVLLLAMGLLELPIENASLTSTHSTICTTADKTLLSITGVTPARTPLPANLLLSKSPCLKSAPPFSHKKSSDPLLDPKSWICHCQNHMDLLFLHHLFYISSMTSNFDNLGLVDFSSTTIDGGFDFLGELLA